MKYRSANTYKYLEPFLLEEDFVLDVGAGSGLVSALIKKEKGARVIGIDVSDLNRRTEDMPLIYDGFHIPFKDKTFSVSVCAFVLHHSLHGESLLEEIARVTRSRIIVLEDLIDYPWDYLLAQNHRIGARIKYGSGRLRFKSTYGWKEAFRRTRLYLEKEVPITREREFYYPVSRKMFVLRP